MTPADIFTMYTQLMGLDLSDAGSKNSAPTDAQALVWINRFKDVLSKRLWQFDPMVTLNLNHGVANTNGAVFDLRDQTGPTVTKTIVEVLKVIINGVQLRGYDGEYGLVPFSTFDKKCPTWRTDATGTPVRAVDMGNQRMILYPPPSATVLAQSNHFLSVQYIAKDLIATTVTTGATSATQTLGSTAGIAAGDYLYFATAGVYALVSSVTNATVLVLSASITTSTNEKVYSVPDMPNECWSALAYGAIQLSAAPNVTEATQIQRLALYDKNLPEMISEISYQNKRAHLDPITPMYDNEYLVT
jgi:hypothetical protein